MKYLNVTNLFKLQNLENEDINLLDFRDISKEAFKVLLTLKDEEIILIKSIIQKLYSSRFFKEYEIVEILNIILLNFKNPFALEFMIKYVEKPVYIPYDLLSKYFEEIQDEVARDFLYDEIIWNYRREHRFKALRIYKASREKYPDGRMEGTIKDILKTETIISNYRDYEISVFISLCQNKYALSFLLERSSDYIDILANYSFTNIETCLKYLNKIGKMDESIISFAVDFLRKYNLRLFCEKDNPDPSIENIEEIINLFFNDNNIHFEINDIDAIWHYLEVLEDIEVTKNQTFAGKKALIDFLTVYPKENRIVSLLINNQMLKYLDGKDVITLYNEIAKNPLQNPSCEELIYNELSTISGNNLNKLLNEQISFKELSNYLYQEILKVSNVTEYVMTVEEYLKKCNSINELLQEIKKNKINEFDLNTKLRMYQIEK